MNWLAFDVKRSKVKVALKPHGQISSFGEIISPVSGMRGCILMKLATVTPYWFHVTLMTFQGHGVKGQGHTQHFLKVNFFSGGIPVDSSL